MICDTASGLQYHLDEVSRELSFKVVLLVPIKRHRVHVETFASKIRTWNAMEVSAQGGACCFGGISPRIYVSNSFYLQRRFRSRLIR